MSTPPTPVPVLLYHSISDRASVGFRRWTVSPERFADQMHHLASSGFNPLTAANFAGCLQGESSLPTQPVVVTFDDGYADFAAAAAPVLRSYGISATLFLSAGYIEGTSEWLIREGETDRRMLTWANLDELADDQIELGCHGYSHRQMDTLSLQDALDDIGRGKTLIEDRTGRTVESLAYPYGYATPALRQRTPDLGFTSAYAVVDAMSSTDDHLTAISRIIVDADTTLDRFTAILNDRSVAPRGRPYTWQQAAWRAWRRGRLALRIDRPHVPA